MSKKWFAVRTKTKQEDYAREQYARQGFEAYLPRTVALTNHARKKSWVERPFFPGYLFLHLAPEERCWTTIACTYGGIGAVCFGSHFPPIPTEVIDTLKQHEDENGIILCESRPDAPFRPEQRVRVVDGPMSDLEGIFQCMSGEDRVLVLMDLLNRTVNVQLPLKQVAGF